MTRDVEAIVIGGGPAGATAATVLAQHGRRVLLLEREKFPRYHIGESLIPYTYFTLERLGLIERLRHSHFPKKYSVQFVSQSGQMSQPFYFTQHRDHPAMQTWQVVRSEFDHLLLTNARDHGADVREQMTVTEFVRNGNGAVSGVRAVDRDGQTHRFEAPLTIDASGRDGFTQIPAGWRVRDPYLNKVAIWTYVEGAVRDPGLDEGATTVAFLPEKGWFWYIPWPRNLVSVGIVAEASYLYRDTRNLEEIFRREVAQNRWIQEHLAPGRVVAPYRVTAEFSYRARHCAADGVVLAGDAFAFLDPVFSSGVFLALKSGEMAADAVHAALRAGRYSADQFVDYGRELCRGIEAMRRLVYAFYDHNFSFKDVIQKHPDLRGRLTDCLIGDLFGDFDELFGAIAEFARVPGPLPYGQPQCVC